MVIFHSYVSLPEGNGDLTMFQGESSIKGSELP